MHQFITDIVYFSEPFDRYHAYLDLQRLSEVNGGIVRTPERVMSARWMWSIGKVRRYLGELVEHGALQQIKSGRNNVLRLPFEHGDPLVSKRARADQFRTAVVGYAETMQIEIAVLNQYIDYWLKYNPASDSYKFESFEGFDIGKTLTYWLTKNKSLTNHNNLQDNGKNIESAAHGSATRHYADALTLEDIKQ